MHDFNSIDQATPTKEASEAKALLVKRDEDLNRVRQQRDLLDAQLKELRAASESKWSAINKYRDLAQSRGVCRLNFTVLLNKADNGIRKELSSCLLKLGGYEDGLLLQTGTKTSILFCQRVLT